MIQVRLRVGDERDAAGKVPSIVERGKSATGPTKKHGPGCIEGVDYPVNEFGERRLHREAVVSRVPGEFQFLSSDQRRVGNADDGRGRMLVQTGRGEERQRVPGTVDCAREREHHG